MAGLATTGSATPRRIIRFAAFEFDSQNGELRKHGLRIKLQGQPIHVLTMLLERPGEVVTREEVQSRLWPGDTYVDFEHSLNAAIKRLRAALGDSADSPRFVETLPRRGYRFIAPLSWPAEETVAAAAQTSAVPQPAAISLAAPAEPPTAARRRPMLAIIIAASLVVLAGIALLISSVRFPLGRNPASGSIRSLAVLPLANLSGDRDQDYFVDGMTDALRQNLEGISALRVISRTSSMHYRGSTKSLPEIAHDLNVDAAVEGSVLRSGDRVRITVELVDGATEKRLWGNSFEAQSCP